MNLRHLKLNYLSFFSGALGLDLGLEQIGFTPKLYCEVDKTCQQTIQANHPDVPLIGDIRLYSVEEIRNAAGLSQEDTVDLVVGGPPCQAFSTAGARRSFEDERGNVFLKYLEVATGLKARFIVIENVRGLLSAAYKPSQDIEDDDTHQQKGSALRFIISYLESKGYGVTFNLYNSANFGVPQIRERLVIIASADGSKLPYLNPTHSDNPVFNLPAWLTLQQALEGINTEQDFECATFPEKRLKYYRLLKAGENWKNLPVELQMEAMGKSFYLGGGKTGFLRRLAWNRPSPTLVTSPCMPATDLAHPEQDRPLSVVEYARIQQFPDHWYFAGKTTDKYKQIGNAVPVGLGTAIGKVIANHINSCDQQPPKGFPFSRYKFTSDKDWLQAFKNESRNLSIF